MSKVDEVIYNACYKYAKLRPKLNTKNRHPPNWDYEKSHETKNMLISNAKSSLRELVMGCVPKDREIEKIPYSDYSQGSGSIGIDKTGKQECIVKVEQQYMIIKHEEYNLALADIRKNLELLFDEVHTRSRDEHVNL